MTIRIAKSTELLVDVIAEARCFKEMLYRSNSGSWILTSVPIDKFKLLNDFRENADTSLVSHS